MTSEQAYKQFLLIVNKNDTNSNVEIGKAEFVIIYNKEAKAWLNQSIDIFNKNIEIEELQDLLEPAESLTKVSSNKDNDTYKLPENYFRYVNSTTIAKKGKCKKQLRNYPIKPRNINVILSDTNNNPSFEYEETPVIIAKNNLQIYKTDFETEAAYLDYFRLPREIDIAGYIKQDGSNSSNVDPDISDELVERILNRCATEVMRNYQNTEGFQLSQTRQS